MINKQKIIELLITISEIGVSHPDPPPVFEMFPFRNYFNEHGQLVHDKLSENDGLWTRREILTRFLLLQAVLDQGPDIKGIRLFTKDVINNLYKKEIRILHRPLDFFREVGISADELLHNHEVIKKLRAEDWARENKSTSGKYNLFMDNTKQVLGYAVYRWGVPLAVPYLLEKDLQKEDKEPQEPLVNYLEHYPSAEIMSQEMKDHERYGLGKAIGDKAAHLFAKWYIHSFALIKQTDNIAWGDLSYELPFDSNAGRVLFRTGFLFELATLKELEKMEVVQRGKGKGGKHYIRVTKLRDKKTEAIPIKSQWRLAYKEIVTQHLKTCKRVPKTVKIQQSLNAFLKGTQYGIGHLDDGIIYIGTTFCRNHETPRCSECPVNKYCLGYNERQDLIDDYRT
jgi:hypothetical protein